MTSPRSYDGVGYPSPSFSSGTPIYDSLVAERGVPQIAPINVPAALPPATYGSGYGSNYGSGYGTGFDSPVSSLPALPPARLALGPGPSSGPATSYIPAQTAPSVYAAAPQPAVPGYGSPQPYLPPQRPQAPVSPAPQAGYQTGQSFGGQNGFASAPSGMSGQQFGAQGFGQGPQQGFADQSFGGNQLRPAAPVAPVRPVQQQYPGPAYYPQAG
ncbi:DUF6643 family protein [Kitasatospora sp. NPDC085895]|uniref:DUF6643 family protein n=1 Tax=Kitasatospora sp. NPDC085895 TaxID=3155057 RepID=UPI0034508ADB